MENHIVRIYRRDGEQPDSIVGLVESVETGEIQSFHSLSELTGILAESPRTRENTATDRPYSQTA